MCAAAHGWVGLGRIVYVCSAAQLVGWLAELGVPAPPVRPLPIRELVPGLVVEGPVPDLAEKVRDLHLRFYGSGDVAEALLMPAVMAVRSSEFTALMRKVPFLALPREEIDRLHAALEVLASTMKPCARELSILRCTAASLFTTIIRGLHSEAATTSARY
jgi:hypothetical protein